MNVKERMDAFQTYADIGKWTACRIQPVIYKLTDDDIPKFIEELHSRKVKHVMVEGMKFFTSNKLANARVSECFKQLTGKTFDLEAYYRACGSRYSGNDIELPTWLKYKYAKVFKAQLSRLGMTYGAADNDLRFLGDSYCCCLGTEKLKGFENLIKHGTAAAMFKAMRSGLKEFDYSIIKGEWFPEGKFRQVKSIEKLQQLYAGHLGIPMSEVTYEMANRPVKELFMEQWNKGGKNSPAMFANVYHLGSGHYKFLTQEQLDKKLQDHGDQLNLGDIF
jgi:hypothetical protein